MAIGQFGWVGGILYISAYIMIFLSFKNNKYKKPYIITNQRECFNCNSNCKYLKDGQEKWPCLHAVTVVLCLEYC